MIGRMRCGGERSEDQQRRDQSTSVAAIGTLLQTSASRISDGAAVRPNQLATMVAKNGPAMM